MKKIFYMLLLAAVLITAFYWISIPDVSVLKKGNPGKTAMMEYREAGWAAKGKKRAIYRVWIPYSRISPYLVKAVIIAEDDKFWRHEGFDYEAIQKAMEKDIKAGKFKAGGSTISQQLAKNLYLSPEKSLVRKIKEAIITWRLERVLTKRRILELYLNVVEWGDGIFGIEAASRHYFGKPASDLTPMEAARLAAVLPNPRRFDASGDQRYVNRRANIIYHIMVKRGIVIPDFEEVSGGPVKAITTLHLNPQGKVMILEYHKIGYPEARWTRTPENFRKDLQRFYERGYRLIRLGDFLEDRIRVEKGRTPLILTFDDSSPGQLRFLPDGKGGYRVDPDCAVGILESFYAAHPDFGLVATFFVLPAADPPNRLFNQPEYTREKLRYLVRKGFEIGNHTYWHATLSKMSSEGVRRQLALAVKAIQEAVPGYSVKTLSLPMGIYPKDTGLLLQGSYDKVSYRHLGVMMVAGGPANPPAHPSFDPLRIPRIQAVERELDYWLRYFDSHPEERYAGG